MCVSVQFIRIGSIRLFHLNGWRGVINHLTFAKDIFVKVIRLILFLFHLFDDYCHINLWACAIIALDKELRNGFLSAARARPSNKHDSLSDSLSFLRFLLYVQLLIIDWAAFNSSLKKYVTSFKRPFLLFNRNSIRCNLQAIEIQIIISQNEKIRKKFELIAFVF